LPLRTTICFGCASRCAVWSWRVGPEWDLPGLHRIVQIPQFRHNLNFKEVKLKEGVLAMRKHNPNSRKKNSAKGSSRGSPKKLNKGDCRYFSMGQCSHFHGKCFDCKEYQHQASYRRKSNSGENWRRIM